MLRPYQLRDVPRPARPFLIGIQERVDIIRERELSDLTLLGAKGRSLAHTILDTAPEHLEINRHLIPVIATIDRTFQQRRLLEGKSTANVHSLTEIIEKATDSTPIQVKPENKN